MRVFAFATFALLLSCAGVHAQPSAESLHPGPFEAIATGNEWLALPEIRPSDAALMSFNVLSWRDRGLLEVRGDGEHAVVEPHFAVDGRAVQIHEPSWRLLAQWIPEATQTIDGLEYTITYCAPDGFRAALIRLTVTNRRAVPTEVLLGLRSSFGALNRVTYVPVALRGERRVGPAPWVSPGEAYSFVTEDTRFSWAVIHPGSSGTLGVPPAARVPQADATQTHLLMPGDRTEANFVLAVGNEEFSAAHAGRALREALDRLGSETLINRTIEWCRTRSRTTGHEDLDALMNRNLLFTRLYAWGRTLDTEQLVGVTSRSPRYYVSAAYWDRDAMLWSFPGLLDSDRSFAREALDYALTVQRRNTGTHSRFIDGTVLEDGFQLDEAAAPLIALSRYVQSTDDWTFVKEHRAAMMDLYGRLLTRLDGKTGLYESMQDAQDEYQKKPFITVDNVLVWRTFMDLAGLFRHLGDAEEASHATRRAEQLRAAIFEYTLTGPPTARRFVSATDGTDVVETDIPPASLLTLPALGFVAENDPRFQATYDWLHSSAYRYSYADKPYGFPGSYRLPFTPVWTVAAELELARSRERALNVLRTSHWDNGIATEGVDPSTAQPDLAGRAFATAAGYLAHAICHSYCTEPVRRRP